MGVVAPGKKKTREVLLQNLLQQQQISDDEQWGIWAIWAAKYRIVRCYVETRSVRLYKVLRGQRVSKCLSDIVSSDNKYEGWNFNSGNYLFTTDTK